MADDFFDQEVRETRAALRNCVKLSWNSVQRNSDVRPLIRERPLVSLLAAAAGGFVAGFVATPPRRTPEERRKRREAKAQKTKHKEHGLTGQLLGAVNPMLRTFAATAAGAIFHGAQSAEPEEGEYRNIPHHRMQI